MMCYSLNVHFQGQKVNGLCLRVNLNVRFHSLTDLPRVLILMKIYSRHTKIYPSSIPRVLEAPSAVPERREGDTHNRNFVMRRQSIAVTCKLLFSQFFSHWTE